MTKKLKSEENRELRPSYSRVSQELPKSQKNHEKVDDLAAQSSLVVILTSKPLILRYFMTLACQTSQTSHTYRGVQDPDSQAGPKAASKGLFLDPRPPRLRSETYPKSVLFHEKPLNPEVGVQAGPKAKAHWEGSRPGRTRPWG